MSLKKKIILILSGLILLALLVLVLMPSPVPVSVAQVEQGHFEAWVEDEGRTRLRAPYTVSSPINGYLRRVELEPGDEVDAGDPLFELEALPAPALDPRAREQAREAVSAARSRLEATQAELETRETRHRQAQAEFERIQALRERELVSVEQLDRARTERDASRAAERGARHAVEVARFELEAARANLEIADGERARTEQPTLAVRAPISGTITRRHRCCEGPVMAGEEIMEIGDLADLEIRVDLLSMDAVRVRPGMRVEIDRWGGNTTLEGEVRRVEPGGFMRVSALGVDEQRVPVIVRLSSPREDWRPLGDGFRVEARFILWEGDDVIHIPTSALFRQADQWHVFVVHNGRAQLRAVETGRRSGLRTQITDGLDGGETLITHPGDRIEDGRRVQVD
ncbi:efflux RND transporter periplasmic adaptor subunit [Natronospira bacteriovora]|uniref:Efflux RND transporter periplasmic adaptor subunit n=1 Tax=Natronospira bacteriovora TaxID=3069753 RepID=A0ABU0W7W7_9GAMM|nr:efflux RND transporter periplasmic adaptor subunit [Natronospira sp. AB-CW4]MDQ2070096.1 efflux RND transporter periplasmic adaptor subunit [Natronospira sp. AB-CW4]